MNYLSKTPLPNDEYYYKEHSYAVIDQTGSFRLNAQGSNQENWRQGQVNQSQYYVNYNCYGHYVQGGSYNYDNNFKLGNCGNINDKSGPYVPLQNREVGLRYGGGGIAQVEDMLQKMMRRLDASDEHVKELRGDLSNIGQKWLYIRSRLSISSYKWTNCLLL